MLEITTFLPQYEPNQEYNTDLLRKSVPIMVKNNISTRPINYAIWYEYVAGNNSNLNHAINTLIKNKTPFDDATSLSLYKNHICNASIESFEKINTDLQGILNNTANAVQASSNKVLDSGHNFSACSSQLEQSQDPDEIKTVLTSIIAETKQLTEISQALITQLDDAHNEMDQLRHELSKVKKMASTDALTGLLNRRAFDSEIINLIDRQENTTHCLLMLDLDHFKKVNDTYGHIVGDKVIRYTAGLLKKHTSAHHQPARYGGEEMAVIMPNTELTDALKISESIRNSLSSSQLKQKDTNQAIGKITVSIGVTTLKHTDDISSFISRADKALYEAKENGRNQVIHH